MIGMCRTPGTRIYVLSRSDETFSVSDIDMCPTGDTSGYVRAVSYRALVDGLSRSNGVGTTPKYRWTLKLYELDVEFVLFKFFFVGVPTSHWKQTDARRFWCPHPLPGKSQPDMSTTDFQSLLSNCRTLCVDVSASGIVFPLGMGNAASSGDPGRVVLRRDDLTDSQRYCAVYAVLYWEFFPLLTPVICVPLCIL